MPPELKLGSKYFFGEDDVPFDNDFFELVDPNKPIELVIDGKKDNGASSG